MPTTSQWLFGPFRLDLRSSSLWREHQFIPLRPKACAVLACLVAHADQVVTKEALLDAVWPETTVTDGALKTTIDLIRQALGDSARQPQYIRTEHRRGYRFIAPVIVTEDTEASTGRPITSPLEAVLPDADVPNRHLSLIHSTTPLIGRATELNQLSQAFSQALHGERQVVLITGEAGIGKTSVLQAFIEQAASTHSVWIGQGHCIEQYGTGEAYLPILEALSGFGQSADRSQLVDILNQFAPTWLIQMPALVGPDAMEALSRRAMRSTPERMLREAAEAVEVLTAIQPLMLCLEDLHWSDHATLNLLSYLARRPGRARLVIVGTYRPSDVTAPEHPLPDLVRGLRLHQQCEVLPLALLTADHITTYLTQRLGDQAPPRPALRAVAQRLYQRTEGNPLFMLNMTDYLIEHDQLVTRDGQWAFTESTALLNIPSGLQPFIELRIDQLQAEERELLEVASVAGEEFSVGAVAAALGADIQSIERQCETLVRQERFIERRAERNYPDGAVTARYGFLHILYQETLYARLTLTRRIHLHGHLGSWEEAAYGAQAPGIAAELAMHFERGHHYSQAIDYHQHAAELAIQQVANQQAISHVTTALELLSQLPETAERDLQEIALQSILIIPFLITKGYTAPEVETACGRARELCRQYPQAPQLFSVLFGLMRFYSTTGHNDVGREIAEQMRALAQQVGDQTWMMLAYAWLGGSAANAGDLVRAHEDLTQALSRYDHPRHKDLFYQYSDPTGVVVCTYLMYISWFRGYPDQAEQYAQKAMIWADDIAHPFVVAGANFFGAFAAYFCGDAQRAEHHADITLTLATEYHIVNFEALARWCHGWARCAQGHTAEGLGQMQSGLALARQIGFQLFIPDGLLVQAQCYLQVGQIEDGLDSLTEAAKMIEQSNMRACEAEWHRLRGELLLARARQRHLVDVNHPDQREAEGCFQRALEIASQQGAKSWALRVTMSQCRFWQQQDRREDAYRALKTIHDEFTEGFATQDLQDAKVLLAELAASQSA